MANKRLRSGFTTGACAAAAAKAACLIMLSNDQVDTVEIPFPEGQRHSFAIINGHRHNKREAQASVIKDAGDDPDVTNGAEITAHVTLAESAEKDPLSLRFVAGEGIGIVTKPGLTIAVGEAAITPVPRQMITAAIAEALVEKESLGPITATVTIIIPKGRELAEKTLNHRLGIVGGLSVLGTTGIVRPVSAEAWTATIEASMAVARETGCREIVLSTGRTSEKGVQAFLNLPVESFAMMGDYLHFSLTAAARNGFTRIHLAGMWAKILKAAMAIPQTHVRHGALEVEAAAKFIGRLSDSQPLCHSLAQANTAREIYDRLLAEGRTDLITKVCTAAKNYAEDVAQRPVSVYLVNNALQVAAHV
ncbi:MAG: cobalt-precorrin-5B (C(1))-methyltransferase CbiD [Proteobacteria bacterium]|nr:cobalt-precorrin-5B (C(1))-methyltransferase CbiD [Pseudomonadota bacterium]MDP2105813.1 cobalt-precorrin-5B (C(1))-methyltransferase CbiD [Desulfobulbaceae bacterium]